MDIKNLKTIVCAWAQSKGGVIQRIWLFGSTARGNVTKGSDIDLAMEIRVGTTGGVDESGGFANWALISDGWDSELSELLGREVQVEFYAGPETPIINQAVSKDGILLFPFK